MLDDIVQQSTNCAAATVQPVPVPPLDHLHLGGQAPTSARRSLQDVRMRSTVELQLGMYSGSLVVWYTALTKLHSSSNIFTGKFLAMTIANLNSVSSISWHGILLTF
uniref:Uncharacterized protein n=1 Tax=Setaria viridis TaxID=4556 RepID=A0A4U6VNI2_SETVI|nr:hypothetical protein SEVIR_3G385000v2 [Setaria viridis]